MRLHPLIIEIQRHADRFGLWAPGDRLAVAVSGGADSVALLLLLHQAAESWGLQLAVAHFDHAWRPESEREADSVARLAHSLALPMFRARATNPTHANREHAARLARYQFLQSLLAQGHATRIATAHTADDQAETVLLRLLRGAGPRGLAGILPARPLGPFSHPPALVRPLLALRRAPLRAWLATQQQPWFEDPSNADLHQPRALLRHRALPALQSALNAPLVEPLATLAEICRAEEEYWASLITPLALQLWTPRPAALLSPRSAWSGFPLALRRRLMRAGVERLQGDLLGLDFASLDQLVSWTTDPIRHPRQRPLGRLTAFVHSRSVLLCQNPALP